MNFFRFLVNLIPIKEIRKEFRQILIGTLPVTISESTRCLMIAPHPDDEVIGCGGIMAKYAKHFDCICIASSGLNCWRGVFADNCDFAEAYQVIPVKQYLAD